MKEETVLNSTISGIVQVAGNGAAAGLLPASAAAQGHGLAPGFYLVLWSVAKSCREATRRARYFGPFSERSVAERLRTSAAYLGIVALCESASVAEACCSVAA